ncbi:MAG: hypothetical protein AB7R67_20185 [Vicinamibacterales bacterium]
MTPTIDRLQVIENAIGHLVTSGGDAHAELLLQRAWFACQDDEPSLEPIVVRGRTQESSCPA